MNYDFCGWATKNDLKCSDGRTIRKDAFKGNNGKKVPLVWNHCHDDPNNVLGHCLLENRDEGVWTYGVFNDTPAGQNAKLLVIHKDVDSLSIYANKLQQTDNKDVLHGDIKEVSLVLAGANPGATIEAVLAHGEASDDDLIIYYDEKIEVENEEEPIEHTAIVGAEKVEPEEEEKPKPKKSKKAKEKEEVKDPEKNVDEEEISHADDEETVEDVINTMNEKQKKVMYALIAAAMGEKGGEEDEKGDEEMKQNAFDSNKNEEVLSHAEEEAIFAEAKNSRSLKEVVLAHGITNIGNLFPEDKAVSNVPDWVKREDGWVSEVMNGVHRTPFSRVKSTYADITEADARARGYIKGKQKVEEVFAAFKRSTDPQTIYKKQKLHRDDVIDITDFDVVAWLKQEMRWMLNEEIARAILVGDGRAVDSDDHISHDHIRPIWTDNDVYTIKQAISVSSSATTDEKCKAFIRACVKSRKNYKGSGNPVLFTTEDVLTDCLLMEDQIGHVIYDSADKLATAMRVRKIVTVPVMEGLNRNDNGTTKYLWGIIVNLNDYNVGADKGGAVSMFDDFDIDYNAQKYLIETRCSGALIKPYSAIALEMSFQ